MHSTSVEDKQASLIGCSCRQNLLMFSMLATDNTVIGKSGKVSYLSEPFEN